MIFDLIYDQREHFVETNLGIAIAATMALFWVLDAIIP